MEQDSIFGKYNGRYTSSRHTLKLMMYSCILNGRFIRAALAALYPYAEPPAATVPSVDPMLIITPGLS